MYSRFNPLCLLSRLQVCSLPVVLVIAAVEGGSGISVVSVLDVVGQTVAAIHGLTAVSEGSHIVPVAQDRCDGLGSFAWMQ